MSYEKSVIKESALCCECQCKANQGQEYNFRFRKPNVLVMNATTVKGQRPLFFVFFFIWLGDQILT